MSWYIFKSRDADRLAEDSIILTEQGGFWQKTSIGTWIEPGNTKDAESEDLTYPAKVIYEPED